MTLAWLAVFSKAEKAPRRRLMAFDNFRHAAQCRWVCWTKRLLDCWTVSKRLVQSTRRNPPMFPLYLLRSWGVCFWRGGKIRYSAIRQKVSGAVPKSSAWIRLNVLFQWSFLGSLANAGNMKIMFTSSYFRSVTQERVGSKTFWAKSEELHANDGETCRNNKLY